VYSDADVAKLKDLKGNWKVLQTEEEKEDNDFIQFTEFTDADTPSESIMTLQDIDLNDI
jgi:hypothetical protein